MLSLRSNVYKGCRVLGRSASSKSYAGLAPPVGPMRTTPQYTVFGEKTMMSVKVLPPTFRSLKNGGLVLDGSKKGRILLEWSPRAEAGKSYDTQNSMRIALD